MSGSKYKYIGSRMEHVVKAELALGKPLPHGSEVHHFDCNKANNTNRNLVICESHSYHKLLHLRTEALQGCGNPEWRTCMACKQWDSVDNLWIKNRGLRGNERYHRQCRYKRKKQWEARRGGTAR